MSRIATAALGLALLLPAAAGARTPQDDLDAPTGEPGRCFERVAVKEVWQTTPERRLVTPEHVEHRSIPAEYGWRDRQVLVRAAHVEHDSTPATYRTSLENVVLRPPSTLMEVVPATYKEVTRRILVQAERKVWSYAHVAPLVFPGEEDDPVTPTGDLRCVVVEPAVYRNVIEYVVSEPERTVEVRVPAVTEQVARQVIDQPAHEEDHTLPAEYATTPERVLVRAAREEAYTVPAVYTTVSVRRLVRPAGFEWRASACRALPPGSSAPAGQSVASPTR